MAWRLPLLAVAGAVHHYFDWSRRPDLEPFIRFEPFRIGGIYDDRGKALIDLAREYRRVVSYDEVPLILREAVLAAEDKNFFSHSCAAHTRARRDQVVGHAHGAFAPLFGPAARPIIAQNSDQECFKERSTA